MKVLSEARLRRIERTANNADSAIKRIRSEEDVPEREAALYNIRTGVFMFGTAAHRPEAGYLKNKGTQGLLYYATDTGVLSGWDGGAWKSTTLV